MNSSHNNSDNLDPKIWASVIKSKALESEASLHLFYDFHKDDPEVVILKDVLAQRITKSPRDVMHLMLITLLQIISSDNLDTWNGDSDI